MGRARSSLSSSARWSRYPKSRLPLLTEMQLKLTDDDEEATKSEEVGERQVWDRIEVLIATQSRSSRTLERFRSASFESV